MDLEQERLFEQILDTLISSPISPEEPFYTNLALNFQTVNLTSISSTSLTRLYKLIDQSIVNSKNLNLSLFLVDKVLKISLFNYLSYFSSWFTSYLNLLIKDKLETRVYRKVLQVVTQMVGLSEDKAELRREVLAPNLLSLVSLLTSKLEKELQLQRFTLLSNLLKSLNLSLKNLGRSHKPVEIKLKSIFNDLLLKHNGKLSDGELKLAVSCVLSLTWLTSSNLANKQKGYLELLTKFTNSSHKVLNLVLKPLEGVEYTCTEKTFLVEEKEYPLEELVDLLKVFVGSIVHLLNYRSDVEAVVLTVPIQLLFDLLTRIYSLSYQTSTKAGQDKRSGVQVLLNLAKLYRIGNDLLVKLCLQLGPAIFPYANLISNVLLKLLRQSKTHPQLRTMTLQLTWYLVPILKDNLLVYSLEPMLQTLMEELKVEQTQLKLQWNSHQGGGTSNKNKRTVTSSDVLTHQNSTKKPTSSNFELALRLVSILIKVNRFPIPSKVLEPMELQIGYLVSLYFSAQLGLSSNPVVHLFNCLLSLSWNFHSPNQASLVLLAHQSFVNLKSSSDLSLGYFANACLHQLSNLTYPHLPHPTQPLELTAKPDAEGNFQFNLPQQFITSYSKTNPTTLQPTGTIHNKSEENSEIDVETSDGLEKEKEKEKEKEVDVEVIELDQELEEVDVDVEHLDLPNKKLKLTKEELSEAKPIPNPIQTTTTPSSNLKLDNQVLDFNQVQLLKSKPIELEVQVQVQAPTQQKGEHGDHKVHLIEDEEDEIPEIVIE